MREKSKRQKRVVTKEQQNKIIELHKQLPLNQIAEQLKMRYDWAYQWARNQGLILKYCRKVEPSRRMPVEVKGHIFDWEHYHNGETIMVGIQSKEDVLRDLKEPKDRAFLKKFPYFGKDLGKYLPVSKRN